MSSRNAEIYTCNNCRKEAEGQREGGPLGWLILDRWASGGDMDSVGDFCSERCNEQWLSRRRSDDYTYPGGVPPNDIPIGARLMTEPTDPTATTDAAGAEPTSDPPSQDAAENGGLGNPGGAEPADAAAAAAAESAAAEARVTARLAATDARIAASRERRLTQPLVTIAFTVPTDADSWLPGAESLVDPADSEVWNAAYVSRPDLKLLARQMPWDFTFETEVYGRTMEGQAGDWLIRYDDTGHVLALTDRAFTTLFAAAEGPVAPEEPAAAEDPPSDA